MSGGAPEPQTFVTNSYMIFRFNFFFFPFFFRARQWQIQTRRIESQGESISSKSSYLNQRNDFATMLWRQVFCICYFTTCAILIGKKKKEAMQGLKCYIRKNLKTSLQFVPNLKQ